MISLFVIMSLSLSVGDEESPDLVSVLLQHLLKLMTREINNPNTNILKVNVHYLLSHDWYSVLGFSRLGILSCQACHC